VQRQSVLTRIAAELAQHQRGRHRTLFDRSGEPQDFIPMGAYLLDVQPVAANHRLERVIGGIALWNSLVRVSDTWRESKL
jgi:hypothetical protein